MLLNASVFAQNGKNLIKTNLVYDAIAIVNLNYEHAISEKSSIEIGVNFTMFSNSTVDKRKAIDFAYRHYLSEKKKSPEGAYISPIISLYSSEYLDYNYNINNPKKGSTEGIGYGLKGGYQIISESGISIDFFGGFGMNSSYNPFSLDGTGGVPIAGIALGYNF
jgi:hypothetical protein